MAVKEKQELKVGSGRVIEYWPELNCLDQDDPRLLKHIRTHQLQPPPLVASTMNNPYYGAEVAFSFEILRPTSVFRGSLGLLISVSSLRRKKEVSSSKLGRQMEGS